MKPSSATKIARDQAILFLHVATTVDGSEGEDGTQSEENGYSQLRTLQQHGIHTATDLMNAYEAAERRSETKAK